MHYKLNFVNYLIIKDNNINTLGVNIFLKAQIYTIYIVYKSFR